MKDRSLLYAIIGLSIGIYPIVRSLHLSTRFKPVDLSFVAADGSTVDLSNMRGKVVLIDFWATWCPGCMEEAPNVVAAYNNLHSQGLEVVGVSLDLDENQMETVAQQRGMAWPQYFDGKAWRNAIAAKYHVNEIPALWLLDKNGMLVDTNGADHLQEKVEKLLAQQ